MNILTEEKIAYYNVINNNYFMGKKLHYLHYLQCYIERIIYYKAVQVLSVIGTCININYFIQFTRLYNQDR